MEAGTAQRPVAGRAPGWLLGVAPLIVIGLSLIAFLALGGPGLGERTGPPVEEVAIERTVLRPGEIVLTLRNDGPDQVSIAQALVNDAFVPPSSPDGLSLERLGSIELTLPYDWVEGEAYEVALLTSTGATVDHSIPVAAETPETDLGFFGLMALLGLYVGVIPVSLGMLWLPFVRRIGRGWMRALMAFTVGLLAFLAIDAALEGLEIAAAAPAAFGGPALVFLGAIVSYLALVGVGAWLRGREDGSARPKAAPGGGESAAPAASSDVAAGKAAALPLLIAIGIGLHNLGEGLAIGSAYAVGSLALGTFLVVGFALHNTTEGLAIVAPLAAQRPSLRRLLGLGLVAGAPAILGAWIGAVAFNPSLAALLFGAGVGAIVQVMVQIAPAMREPGGKTLAPLTVGGLLTALAVMYATGLLVAG